MKIHVSKLEGRALDYATSLAVGDKVEWLEDYQEWGIRDEEDPIAFERVPCYSGSWAQCGPLQDKFDLLVGSGPEFCWARLNPVKEETPTGRGGTRMVAICRAIVAAKLGDEIEVPNELIVEVKNEN